MERMQKMVLGKNIRYLRKQRGWSQDYLAELLNYKNYTTVQKWESGMSEPRFAAVQQLANIFNVGIDDLTSKDLENPEASSHVIDTDAIYMNTSSVGHDMLFKSAHDATEDELIQTANYLNYLKSKRKD